MKAVYKPYSGDTPANPAYARDCGIMVKPTVIPAMRSETMSFFV